MSAYAFDVDGVLVDIRTRLNKAKELSKSKKDFWSYFYSYELMNLDRPRKIGLRLLQDRMKRGKVIIITGRPLRLRDVTINQLINYGIDINKIAYIFMRRDEDLRPAHIVKFELLEKALTLGFDIIEYHDDDEDVLKRLKKTYPHIKLYLHYNDSYRVYWELRLKLF